MKKNKVTSKRLYIKTFGCQMNSRDSEALLGLFLERGYTQAQGYEDADIILLNTCSVRAHAEHRVRSILGSFKKLFAKRKAQSAKSKDTQNAMHYAPCAMPIIGLIGCMARSQGQEIFKRMPYVNLIVGPASLHKIPEYIEKIAKRIAHSEKQGENLRIMDLEDKERKEEFYDAGFRAKSDHAQVVISTGCSNYCSYCVVPYVRGELRLRKPKDIIAEVKRNVALGINKITLLGQNVNDYKYIPSSHVLRPTSFVNLLEMVNEIEGVKEIDFLTPHPKNTSNALFRLMAKSNKIKKYLHLPLQSGSDRILKLMNRGYTKKDYLALVADYKTIVGGTIGTDIIVGFPTETEEDFHHTKDVLEKVNFMGAYIFKYSPRPNTQALKLKDDVPQKVKEKRHKILLDLQKKISSRVK
ncbi:MAG: tRNA (N6-isopentenyl adenosine(37)-C2)-methylthiotransferase MiaB [Candidatus Omnitrophota bacterium]|nr:tRNA (N6-isopentenyl adenosine(37)-C2)-methylthiotransferase MiaB [Candidatus Omnitrophota bacterium]